MLARVTALQLIIMAIVGCCKLLILGVVAAFLTREFLLLIPIGDFQPSIPHCSYGKHIIINNDCFVFICRST